MKTALIHSEKFGSVRYGPEHPMKPVRLRITFELMEALGLMRLPGAKVVEARPATDEEILSVHTPEYLRILKEADGGLVPDGEPVHGLGYGDNPVFKGVFEWSSYCAGASLQAAELVANGEADIAFNIAGGLHHALPDKASGFCYLNDPAIAIKYLLGLGKRVAYIDIDAHHGDGVEHIFQDTDRVLTISIHESGEWLFPGTGFAADTGFGAGHGYSVNLPMPPHAGDELFVKGFNETVPAFIEAFAPDIIVTQLGVDTFETDPITHLSLTTNGFEEIVKRIRSFGLPWVALGGGGYDISNVARAWSLAWAVMNGVKLHEKIPHELMLKRGDVFTTDKLRDEPLKRPVNSAEIKDLEEQITFLKKNVLPLVKKG